jgi:ferredoxin
MEVEANARHVMEAEANAQRVMEAEAAYPADLDILAGQDLDVGTYYTPLKEDGSPAKFLKAKSKADPGKCNRCMFCSAVCPMGSIEETDPFSVTGICIKCQACVRRCPAGARYFDDPDFLSHVRMLEENYQEPKENVYLTWSNRN